MLTENILTFLKNAVIDVYERIAELPFWEEYGELLKSDIADHEKYWWT